MLIQGNELLLGTSILQLTHRGCPNNITSGWGSKQLQPFQFGTYTQIARSSLIQLGGGDLFIESAPRRCFICVLPFVFAATLNEKKYSRSKEYNPRAKLQARECECVIIYK